MEIDVSALCSIFDGIFHNRTVVATQTTKQLIFMYCLDHKIRPFVSDPLALYLMLDIHMMMMIVGLNVRIHIAWNRLYFFQ